VAAVSPLTLQRPALAPVLLSASVVEQPVLRGCGLFHDGGEGNVCSSGGVFRLALRVVRSACSVAALQGW
jgi:hypothetical protein